MLVSSLVDLLIQHISIQECSKPFTANRRGLETTLFVDVTHNQDLVLSLANWPPSRQLWSTAEVGHETYTVAEDERVQYAQVGCLARLHHLSTELNHCEVLMHASG